MVNFLAQPHEPPACDIEPYREPLFPEPEWPEDENKENNEDNEGEVI